jgi:hypothetical protein
MSRNTVSVLIYHCHKLQVFIKFGAYEINVSYHVRVLDVSACLRNVIEYSNAK